MAAYIIHRHTVVTLKTNYYYYYYHHIKLKGPTVHRKERTAQYISINDIGRPLYLLDRNWLNKIHAFQRGTRCHGRQAIVSVTSQRHSDRTAGSGTRLSPATRN